MRALPAGTVMGARWKVLQTARTSEDTVRLLAEEIASGRRVFLRQSQKERFSSQQVQALAGAWRALACDGVARVLEIFEDANELYVVSEYVDGPTLEQYVQGSTQLLKERQLLDCAAQLCDMLDGLGAAGALAAALAPDTLVMAPQGKLILVEHDVLAGLRAQARSKPAESRAGMYGLGATLYFAATRVRVDDTRARMLSSAPLAPLHEVNDCIPVRIGAAVERMLEVEPSRRPASTKDVREALGLPAVQREAYQPPPSVVPGDSPPGQSAAAPVARPPGQEWARSRMSRFSGPISYTRSALALLVMAILFVAWTANLVYVAQDEVRVRVDPSGLPHFAHPLSLIAPRGSPLPTSFTAADGTVMLLVAAGSFPMGVPDPDADNGPASTQNVDAFYIDRTEVTCAQFLRFVRESGYVSRGPWQTYVDRDRMDLPVSGVTAEDAQEYARWYGKRLPTEIEWEKAAHGTQTQNWPWGDAVPEGRALVHYAVTAESSNGGGARPVGSASQGASPYGALDMAGNVWEWTASLYAPYGGSHAHNNLFGRRMRVVRGGSWNFPLREAQTTVRFPLPPRLWSPDVGFRCVMVALP